MVKSETVLLFYPAEGGKRKLPGWTGQTGLTDRSDRSHLKCEEKCCLPDYLGEYPEYPGVAQSIRAKIQTIRELTKKKF